MIDQAILLLKNELQTYLDPTTTVVEVIVDNIGLLDTTHGDNLPEHVVISLVNVEEESTLKNQPALKRPFVNTTATYRNPPVYLNLYLLFTCTYFKVKYINSLERLSAIIQFLQSRNSFAISSSANINENNLNRRGVIDMKFTLELYTLTFEQINHLWGSLGGKQMPFVMYKLRLLAITENAIAHEVPLIEEIDTTLRATLSTN